MCATNGYPYSKRAENSERQTMAERVKLGCYSPPTMGKITSYFNILANGPTCSRRSFRWLCGSPSARGRTFSHSRVREWDTKRRYACRVFPKGSTNNSMCIYDHHRLACWLAKKECSYQRLTEAQFPSQFPERSRWLGTSRTSPRFSLVTIISCVLATLLPPDKVARPTRDVIDGMHDCLFNTP